MFSQVNPCSPRFQQQFMSMESQYPQPGNPINFNQMNSHFSTCQNGFQTNQFHERSQIPCSNSSIFSEDGKTETGVTETEVVHELLHILVECVHKADVRTQQVLLRKFFFEIEKDMSLERFLVERIKHSKLNFLSECLEKIPGRLQHSDRFSGAEISTREVESTSSSSSEEETTEKLERFKVKTVQIGEIVKEEKAK